MKIKASTMSVILSDSVSCSVFVEVAGESCNMTLRFDRGDKAQLCGYPETWDIHDVPVDPYDSESPTGSDLFECDGISSDRTYISAETEKTILKKLLRSVYSQFSDCSWMDCSPTLERQAEILTKIQNTVEGL
jgi:hypothetical protein